MTINDVTDATRFMGFYSFKSSVLRCWLSAQRAGYRCYLGQKAATSIQTSL
jgi:hypothetical protein